MHLFKQFLKKTLLLLLSYSLAFLPLHAYGAGVVVDGKTETTVANSRNDVPVVNIANPNSQGLSHNTYNQFNVDSNGLILNNATGNVNTQLSGYISGNANLSNTATVILNEVTSTSRSTLLGYTEIAGSRADIVIANPNGLTVNGAGFINTSNVTLTTGVPIIHNGQIDAFSVQGGDITIQGAGLDTLNQDSTDIYSHYLKINAKVNAKNLNITLGQNTIGYDDKKIRASVNSGDTSRVLLDSSALGGMYANKIVLVGTDKGLGVNLPPEVLASTGDITITNDGRISLQQMSAQNNIIVDSSDVIESSSSLYAQNSAQLRADNKIHISAGSVAAKNNLSLITNQLSNQGVLVAGIGPDNSLNETGDLTIQAINIDNTGTLRAADQLAVTTKVLNNTGSIAATDVTIDHTQLSNSGKIQSTDTLTITGDNMTNLATLQAQKIHLNHNDSLNAGTIQAGQTLTSEGESLTNEGVIVADQVSIDHAEVINRQTIHGLSGLSINANNITNTDILSSGGTLALMASQHINNAGGQIIAVGDTTINANSLDNSGGEILTDSNQTLTVISHIDNTDGKIKSNQNTTINAAQITSQHGSIETLGNLTITADDFDLTNASLFSEGNLDLSLNALTVLASTNLGSNQNMRLSAIDYISLQADLISGGRLTLATAGTLTNNKIISSAGALSLTAAGLINNGTISGGTGNSLIDISGSIVNNARISGKDVLSVTAATITNNGFFNAGNNLDITSTNLTNNRTLFSGGDMQLYISNHLYNDRVGNIFALNELTIAGNSNLSNTTLLTNDSGSIQTYNGDLNVYASTIDNNASGFSVSNVNDGTKTFHLALDSRAGTNMFADADMGNQLAQATARLTQDKIAVDDYHHLASIGLGDCNGHSCLINGIWYSNSEIILNPRYGQVSGPRGETEIGQVGYSVEYRDRSTQKDSLEKHVHIEQGALTPYLNQYYGQYGLTVEPATYSYTTGGGGDSGDPETHHVSSYYISNLTPLDKESARELNFTQRHDAKTGTVNTGRIASGRHLNISGGTVNNNQSELSAAGNINFSITDLNNNAIPLNQQVDSSGRYLYCFDHCSSLEHNPQLTWADLPSKTTTQVIGSIPATVQAGGSVTGSIDRLNNGTIQNNTGNSITSVNGDTTTTANSQTINSLVINPDTNPLPLPSDGYSIELPEGQYGLFVQSTNPDSQYLIETNPEFTLYTNFISSNYMMESIGFSPDANVKLLGDAFYENKLIRDSIFSQTGKRFLDPKISDDNQQYTYLMNNGIAAQKDLNLAPGIALTVDQINSLTSDIVWLEEQVIDGKRVVVPRVYIATTNRIDIIDGGIFAGQNIDLKTAIVNNAGSIAAGKNLHLSASDRILNQLGNMQSGELLSLLALNDIENNSGTIKGLNVELASLEGDIINRRLTDEYQADGRGYDISYTEVGAAGRIEAEENLSLSGQNVLIQGSVLDGDKIQIDADTVNIETTELKEDFFIGTDSNYVRGNAETHIGSNIDGGQITINSTGNTRISGSTITVGGTDTEQTNVAHAGIKPIYSQSGEYSQTPTRETRQGDGTLIINAGSIDIEDVHNTHFEETRVTTSSTFKSSVTVDKEATSTSQGSQLSGTNISLNTHQGDINITGSEMTADNNLNLDSAGDINIQAGYDGSMEESYSKSSSFSLFDLGSLYSSQLDIEGQMEKNAVNASLQGGNISMNAEGNIAMVGVDLEAEETLSATAQDINIQNATNTSETWSKHESTSVSLGDLAETLSNPSEMINNDDGKVSITLANATYDKTDNVVTSTTANLSNLSAANITLTATGESEDSGNIVLQGSNLTATDTIELDAVNDVALLDAKETTNESNNEQHGSAELSLVIKNEYEQISHAVEALKAAKDAVSSAKHAYSQYKDTVTAQEARLAELREQLDAGTGFIEQVDVDELEEYVDRLKSDKEYYKVNIALAVATVASKATALLAQTAKAAASSGTYGFNAGLELNIEAIETELARYQQQSVASNLNASNITINAGNNATIHGSNLNAGNIDIDSQNLEVIAGTNTSRETSSSEEYNATLSIDFYGGTSGVSDISNIGSSIGGASGSFSANRSDSETNITTHNNATLIANNININTRGNTQIVGATLHAHDTLNLDTQNLTVASVQDVEISKTRGEGISASGGSSATAAGSGQSNTSLGSAGFNNSRSDRYNKETVLTSLTGNTVNINVEQHTELTGATIAALDEDGNDNGQLTLNTNTLSANSLNNITQEDSLSQSISAGSTTTLDYQNDHTNKKTKTLATLGSGTINIDDVDNSDIKMLNSDVENNEVDIYDIESHQGLSATIDTRLFSESGRDQIAEDMLKTAMIGNTIVLIVNDETVSLQDFFSETDQSNKTYEAIKGKIASDPKLAKALQNPDLDADQKQIMLNKITLSVIKELGYEVGDYQNNLITAGADSELGFISDETGQAYINDDAANNTEDLLIIAGHEASHQLDNLKGGEEHSENYATNYGQQIANYSDFALDITNQDQDGGLASSNSHTGNSNSQTLQTNNATYDKLDKDEGEFFLPKYELDGRTSEEAAESAAAVPVAIISAVVSGVVDTVEMAYDYSIAGLLDSESETRRDARYDAVIKRLDTIEDLPADVVDYYQQQNAAREAAIASGDHKLAAEIEVEFLGAIAGLATSGTIVGTKLVGAFSDIKVPGGGYAGADTKPIVKVDTNNSVKGASEYKILNDPAARQPNTKYELDNGDSFRTNNEGLVEELTFTPNSIKVPRDSRQTAAGKQGRDTDVGGHAQACSQGGTCDGYNLFPQDSNFNNSAYKVFYENKIKKALNNPNQTVGPTTIKFNRKDPGSTRPDTLEVTYTIDGKTKTARFENEAKKIPEVTD